MNSTPIIGITGYHVRGEEGVGGSFRGLPGQGFHVAGHDYIHAVQATGGIPVSIPVGDPHHCEELLQRIDGLVLSGGEDIDPSLYGEHPDMRCWTLAPERDRYELELLRAAIRLKKPVLAICRGLQLFNICYGGTLYKDVSDIPNAALSHQFNRAPRWYLAHGVKLLHPELQRLFGGEEIRVNSYHHQAVKDVGRELEVTATAEDGVIEGLRHPDHPQILAVQWHPETMAVQYEAGLIPFRYLMKKIQSGGEWIEHASV